MHLNTHSRFSLRYGILSVDDILSWAQAKGRDTHGIDRRGDHVSELGFCAAGGTVWGGARAGHRRSKRQHPAICRPRPARQGVRGAVPLVLRTEPRRGALSRAVAQRRPRRRRDRDLSLGRMARGAQDRGSRMPQQPKQRVATRCGRMDRGAGLGSAGGSARQGRLRSRDWAQARGVVDRDIHLQTRLEHAPAVARHRSQHPPEPPRRRGMWRPAGLFQGARRTSRSLRRNAGTRGSGRKPVGWMRHDAPRASRRTPAQQPAHVHRE